MANPKLLAPMRKAYRELHQRLEEDDLPDCLVAVAGKFWGEAQARLRTSSLIAFLSQSKIDQ